MVFQKSCSGRLEVIQMSCSERLGGITKFVSRVDGWIDKSRVQGGWIVL